MSLASVEENARRLLVAALVLHGCGGQTAPMPDAGEASDAALGGFVVSLVPAMTAGGASAPAYTSVLGKVYDGPMPSPIVWETAEEAGGCRLLTPRVPFCTAICGGAAACVDGDRCAPYPSALNLGRVRVEGLGSTAFDMDPVAGNYQPGAGVKLPYPPCAEGAVVQVAASGGALGAFSIEGRGIAPLAFDQTPAPVTGQPLRLAWTAPGQPALSRIEVKLDISHHGGAKGQIECDVPDTGSLEIPAAQVSRLLALGVAGFPTIILTRVAAATTAVRAGVVSLQVVSAVERPVQIEGLRSCTEDSQCPPGKVCRSDLTCQ
jgi:hypothetical protein